MKSILNLKGTISFAILQSPPHRVQSLYCQCTRNIGFSRLYDSIHLFHCQAHPHHLFIVINMAIVIVIIFSLSSTSSLPLSLRLSLPLSLSLSFSSSLIGWLWPYLWSSSISKTLASIFSHHFTSFHCQHSHCHPHHCHCHQQRHFHCHCHCPCHYHCHCFDDCDLTCGPLPCLKHWPAYSYKPSLSSLTRSSGD